jgi:uncharacterized membrane protein
MREIKFRAWDKIKIKLYQYMSYKRTLLDLVWNICGAVWIVLFLNSAVLGWFTWGKAILLFSIFVIILYFNPVAVIHQYEKDIKNKALSKK